MTPKRFEPIFDQLVEEFGVDRKFVEILIKFYYKEVRANISKVKKPRIELRGLCCFDLKHWKVKYKLRDTINFIEYHKKQEGERASAIIFNLERKKILLEKVKKLADFTKEDQDEKRIARKKYIQDNHPDLEK